MPPKSIFRRPGVQHFQVVHRSQRDPLIHDPDASQHVLKLIERDNLKKGKSRADLEALLPPPEIEHDEKAKVGEAALYGIYFDDTQYDYMQHLRAVGVHEDGVESVLIEAPSSSKQIKNQKGIQLLDLPSDVLPPKFELPRSYESNQAIPQSLTGLQPDMDPHLRQTLEALEDEAFVQDELDDGFFNELVADGERDEEEAVDFEFFEDGPPSDIAQLSESQDIDGEVGWEERFVNFKKAQQTNQLGSDNESGSESGDTVGKLPDVSAIGGKGKRRRKGTSDASGYSMSSSSMYRNEALQTLDEHFDQMILKNYNGENDEDTLSSVESDDEAPELITSREDFDTMVNEFLNDYEILGRKMKPKLAGESGAEKLDTIRRAMGQDERVWTGNDFVSDSEEELDSFMVEKKKDTWDCETILTTYSNLENHPRLIRAREQKPVPRIVLDSKTGLPTVSGTTRASGKVAQKPQPVYPDPTSEPLKMTISRPRQESKEEKKARKSAVKASRQTRRVDKKLKKEEFDAEMNAQKRTIGKLEVKMKKL